jgi:hypothetical protein
MGVATVDEVQWRIPARVDNFLAAKVTMASRWLTLDSRFRKLAVHPRVYCPMLAIPPSAVRPIRLLMVSASAYQPA